MLYYLFEHLDRCCDFPGAGVFTYVTFRAIFAVICSLLISIYFGKYFINKMRKNKIYEVQRDEKTDPFNTSKVATKHCMLTYHFCPLSNPVNPIVFFSLKQKFRAQR